MKGFFSNNSALFQLGILFYFVLIGLLLNSAVGYVIINIPRLLSDGEPTGAINNSFYALHTIQFFSCILVFILPSICTAYLCNKKPVEFLLFKRSVDVRILLLSIVMMLLISPIIGIAAELNSKIQIPEFMPSVAEFMNRAESHAAKITEKLLSEKGFMPLVTNIFIIGIMAGISEELIFRGALLSTIRKKIKNPHVAIWIVAIIFSIIHFQFSGFIPRIILGAFLGYLLLWTRNIWVPIFVHFLNNLTVIIGYKTGFYQIAPDSAVLTSTNTGINKLYNSELYNSVPIAIIAIIIGVIIFVLLYFCAKKMKSL